MLNALRLFISCNSIYGSVLLLQVGRPHERFLWGLYGVAVRNLYVVDKDGFVELDVS